MDNNNNNSTTDTSINEDWEDWDGKSPFWVHCLAGSIAGCIEHAALYPLDTVRTHIQVCAACIHNTNNGGRSSTLSTAAQKVTTTNGMFASSALAQQKAQQQRLPLGMWGTIRYLMNEPTTTAALFANGATATANHPSSLQPSTTAAAASASSTAGIARLFRGISTVWIGCIPAHALYFSSYEGVKHFFHDEHQSIDPVWVSAAAGAAAVTGHDIILTPLDTLKQRFQLGQYSKGVSVAQAMAHILKTEGTVYQSLGVTLATNIPYGMLMVATQDAVRNVLEQQETSGTSASSPYYSTSTLLIASSCGGCVAAGLTTPLDRIKTALQTQAVLTRPTTCPLQPTPPANCVQQQQQYPRPTTRAVVRTILETEGFMGLWRGIVPRVLSHTPAVAISWTTYETVKQWLMAV